MEGRNEHFIGNVAQKAIIENDRKILVCRGIGDIVWEFPGGRLHKGETPVEGIIREIKEELNLDIRDVKPLCVERSFHYRSKMHQVFIAYLCTCDVTDMKVDQSEIEDFKWVTTRELQDLPMFEDCDAVKLALL